MLKAEGIHKAYGELQVLKGVSLEVQAGEVVAIVGSSGAGKTTLLQILGTLDQADSGELWYADQNISHLKPNRLARFRNEHIGFIFQFHHLLPEFTALENICMPAFIKGVNKKVAEKRGHELLELLHLSERAHHKPGALSGGEQQRVATARALMNNPKIIFADEPSGNLDSKNANSLHQLFFDLRKELNQTFIIVTHNKELAAQCDRTLHMVDGNIV
jgi:lipoprotein-releasing system ATP-binding protein